MMSRTSITTAQLERIAEEIGVDPDLRSSGTGRDAYLAAHAARRLLPSASFPTTLFETTTLPSLSRDDAEAAVTQVDAPERGSWCEAGLRRRRYRVARRSSACVHRMLARSLSGGNRISRRRRRRHHCTASTRLETTEHVVAFESEGRWPLTFAAIVLAVGSYARFGAALRRDCSAGDVWVRGVGAFIGTIRRDAWRRYRRRPMVGRRNSGRTAALARRTHPVPPSPQRRSWFSRRRSKES